jgi:hypothetical protein
MRRAFRDRRDQVIDKKAGGSQGPPTVKVIPPGGNRPKM